MIMCLGKRREFITYIVDFIQTNEISQTRSQELDAVIVDGYLVLVEDFRI